MPTVLVDLRWLENNAATEEHRTKLCTETCDPMSRRLYVPPAHILVLWIGGCWLRWPESLVCNVGR